MVKLFKHLAAIAALSLAAAPVAAAGNPAASLSIAKSARAGSASTHRGNLDGDLSIIGVVAAVIVVIVIVVVASDDPKPKSP